MNYKVPLSNVRKAGLVLNAAFLLSLTGCGGYVQFQTPGVYVAAPVVEVAPPTEYVYYPGYDVYFNSDRHEFVYLDGGVWVTRPRFPGVSVDVLLASPSVRMDFHDSPAHHHAEIARRYPRNWAPAGGHPAVRADAPRPQAERAPARKAPAPRPNQKPEKHDEHESK